MLPRIFVISLTTCRDRRALLEARFNELSLPFEYFDAVTPDTMTDEERRRYDPKATFINLGRQMAPGELGCFFSHRRLSRKIVDENIDQAVILEDDAYPEDTFPRVLQRLAALPSPRSWSVVRLAPLSPKSRREVARNRIEAALGGDHGLYRINAAVIGAGAYLLTAAGAARILAGTNRVTMAFDTFLDRYWENGIDPFVVSPGIVHPRGDAATPSTIGAQHIESHSRLMPWDKLWRRRAGRWKDGVRKRLYAVRRR